MIRLLLLPLILLLGACSSSRHTLTESNTELVSTLTAADSVATIVTHDEATVSASELLASFAGLRLVLSADSITGPSGLTIHRPALELTADSATAATRTATAAQAHDSVSGVSSGSMRAETRLSENSTGENTAEVSAPKLPAWIDLAIYGGALLAVLALLALGLRYLRHCIPDI